MLGEGPTTGPRLGRHGSLVEDRRAGVDHDRTGGRGRVGGLVDRLEVDGHAPVAGDGPAAIAPLEAARPDEGLGAGADRPIGGEVGHTAADRVAHGRGQGHGHLDGHLDGQAVQAAVAVGADHRGAQGHAQHRSRRVGRRRIDLGHGRGGEGARRRGGAGPGAGRHGRFARVGPRGDRTDADRRHSDENRQPEPRAHHLLPPCRSQCDRGRRAGPIVPECSGARLRCYDPTIRRRNGERST